MTNDTVFLWVARLSLGTPISLDRILRGVSDISLVCCEALGIFYISSTLLKAADSASGSETLVVVDSFLAHKVCYVFWLRKTVDFFSLPWPGKNYKHYHQLSEDPFVECTRLEGSKSGRFKIKQFLTTDKEKLRNLLSVSTWQLETKLKSRHCTNHQPTSTKLFCLVLFNFRVLCLRPYVKMLRSYSRLCAEESILLAQWSKPNKACAQPSNFLSGPVSMLCT